MTNDMRRIYEVTKLQIDMVNALNRTRVAFHHGDVVRFQMLQDVPASPCDADMNEMVYHVGEARLHRVAYMDRVYDAWALTYRDEAFTYIPERGELFK